MPDVRFPLVADVESSSSAAVAAAERSEATKRRLLELQQRLDRLRAGQLSTREDVARAKVAAEAQRRACRQAERRMASACSSLWRHTVESNPRQVGTNEVNQRGGIFLRLREAFVALAAAPPERTETLSDHLRRRQLASALIDKAAETASWTRALCQLAVTSIPGAGGAAVSTFDDRQVAHPFAAADDLSLQLEELQQVVGEGPAYQAMLSGRPVIVEDLAQHIGTWPGYVPAVRGYGIGVVWSLPVMTHGLVLASLTLYHHTPESRRHHGLSDAVTLASLASATMIIDAEAGGDGSRPDRSPIDDVAVATGILAVRAGVALDEALSLLRGTAFSTGRRISEVAADVLAGGDLG